MTPITTKRSNTQAKQAAAKAASMTPEAAFERGKEVLAKQATTKTATPETTSRPVPAPFYRPEQLSRTHEMIIDAVTSLLSHGGHPDDVAALTRAAMAHTRRRTVSAFCDDAGDINKRAMEFIDDRIDEWKEDLAAAWKENRRLERAEAEAKTITERIRVNTRESVTEHFDDFMLKASFEEQVLMLNVLVYHKSRSVAAENTISENYLASAFETEIGRNAFHLSVPERMVDDVENYIKALRAIDKAA